MKEEIKSIRSLEDKYGLVLFRMGLSHLVDVGYRNLGDDEVEESIKQIMDEGQKDEEDDSFISPEFKCEIIRCAAELTRFSIWTLFGYIKKYMEIGGM